MKFLSSPVSFLLRISWWHGCLATCRKLAASLFIPALLFAISNCCSVYSEFVLRSGIDLGFAETSQQELGKLISITLQLSFCGFAGMILGLISLSLWLFKLTGLARKRLLEISDLEISLGELKSQTKYLSSVWLWGLLYLLGPVLPMSVLLSFSLLSAMKLSYYGEFPFALPAHVLLAANTASFLLFMLTLEYSVVLTCASSLLTIKPRKAAALSFEIICKRFLEIQLLSAFLVLFNLILSAPFLLLQFIPTLEKLSSSLTFALASQVWLAFASIFTWPLTLLAFAEYLRVELLESSSAAEQNSSGSGADASQSS